MRNRFSIYGSLNFCFLLLMLGCTAHPQPTEAVVIDPQFMDRSWLTGEPCKAPCWYGLVPGKSTKEEVLAKVKELPFLNTEGAKEIERRISRSSITFRCKQPQEEICATVNFERNLFIFLNIYPNFAITPEQVVNVLGPPDKFSYSRINPEGKGCDMDMLWVDQQMALSLGDPSQSFFQDLCDRIRISKGRVPKDLEIRQLIYWNADDVKEYIQDPAYKPWIGFAEK